MGIRNREGSLYMATGIDNSGMYAGRREAMGIIKAMASQITSFDVFSGIGISAATAFAKAAKSSYDFEKEFHKNMLEVATISTQVTDDMTGFMNKVMAITQEIPVKAPEAAKALYQIVSAGHDGAAGMKILEVSAKAAVGGITDTAVAADAITTLINAYKLNADEAANISDQLFTTVRLGKTTFGELGQSIAQAAPIAAAYGVEIDQVLAAVATLTKQGTPTAQAMTQIRAAIVGVSKYLGDGAYNGRTFQEALELVRQKAGGSEAKLREFVPEIEAVNGLLALTGQNAQEAASHLSEMGKATGATDIAFKKMLDDADNQMLLLSNNIQAALRPMGQAILKEVSEVAKTFNEAFENGNAKEAMKALGDIVVIVTGAFIGYKGSVIATTTIQNAYTKSLALTRLASIQQTTTTKLLTSAIKLQTSAMLKNIAVFATNPYVIAAAAIAALGYGIYKYITRASAAEEAQIRFNTRLEEQKRIAEELKNKTDQLLDVIKDETKTNYERNKALKALKDLYPQIFENYDIEALKLADILQIKKQIAGIDSQRSYQSNNNYFASLINKRDELDKEISNLSNNQNLFKYLGGDIPGSIYNLSRIELKKNQIKREREIIQHEIDQMYSSIQERSEDIWNKVTPKEIKIVSLENNIKTLEEERDELNKLINGPKGPVVDGELYSPLPFIPSPIDIARLNVVNGLIKDQSEELDVLRKSTDDNSLSEQTILQRKIQMTKELFEARSKLKKLRDPNSTAKESEISSAENKVKELETKLETLTGISSKEGDRLKQLQQELNRSILDSELKLQAGRIAAMEDGKTKRLALAQQETKDTIAAIQKEKEEYQKKIKESKGKEDPAVIKTFDNRETAAKVKEQADIARTEKEYAEEYKQRTRALTDVFLNEEQRKLSAIKTRYAEERKWADQQLKTGGMTKDQHKEYTTNIDNAQQQETYRSLLDNLNDFKQKEKDLRDKWDTDIAAATEAKDAYLVAKLQEGKQKALSSLNGQMLQESDEWQQLFSNLDNLTVKQLEKLSNTIKKKAKDLKLNPVDAQAVTNSLKEVDEKIRTMNPFGLLSKHLKEYKNAETEAAKDQSLKEMFRDTAASIDMVKGSLDAVIGGLNDMGLAGDEATQQLLGDISDLMGAASQLATSIASANPVGIIQGSIGVLTSVFNLFNNDKRHEKKINEFQDQIDVLDKSYEKLGRSIEKAYSKDASKLIEQNNKILEQQKVLIQNQIKEEQDKKKTDDGRIKDWQVRIDAINDAIADNKEKAKDAIFGEDLKSAIENFASAYTEAWASGEDRAESAKDTVKKMMRQMVTESIKAATESSKAMEKIRQKLKEFYADDVLSGWEQDYIYNMAEELQKELDKEFGWADNFFKPDNEVEDTRTATSKGIASISQDSANAIDGKMSSQLIFLDKTLIEVASIREHMAFIRNLQIKGWEDVKAIRELSEKVSDNTGQIATLSDKIAHISENIETNTGNTAKGIQNIYDKGLPLRKQ